MIHFGWQTNFYKTWVPLQQHFKHLRHLVLGQDWTISCKWRGVLSNRKCLLLLLLLLFLARTRKERGTISFIDCNNNNILIMVIKKCWIQCPNTVMSPQNLNLSLDNNHWLIPAPLWKHTFLLCHSLLSPSNLFLVVLLLFWVRQHHKHVSNFLWTRTTSPHKVAVFPKIFIFTVFGWSCFDWWQQFPTRPQCFRMILQCLFHIQKMKTINNK